VVTPTDLVSRIRREVERNVSWARNGLRYVAGVGRPEVGCSPKDVVWRRGKVQLYRYHSDDRTLGPPLLLVMSLVSKPYVLDLRPGNSFVEALVRRGFDVYMLDWGIPDAAESGNSFETYCDEYIPLACAQAMRTSHADGIHVFGYCFGGVLSLLFAAGHPEIPLRTLSLMATPIDFSEMGGMTTLIREHDVDADDFIDETGNVPPDAVLRGINSAKVTGDVQSYAGLLANLDKQEYVATHDAMFTWAHDHIPFPGACFRQTAQWIIVENRLATNSIVTARGELDFTSIRCPVMNSVGRSDHLVPMSSNRPILDVIDHADDLQFDTGHVGLIVGGKAHSVSVPAMADWIASHSDRVAGS
jgi:polyhydroxyalkanoate synthase